MKRILIAHQSTIPHYRVDFFNQLQRLKPDWWTFDVAYDVSEPQKKRFFSEALDPASFEFNILPVKTFGIPFLGSKTVYQTIPGKLRNYDAVVVEHAVYNLAYPLVSLAGLSGKPVGLWGHGKHVEAENPTGLKAAAENFKFWQINKAKVYFAYTSLTEDYLKSRNVDASKIVTLNNTIGIDDQRKAFEKEVDRRDAIRAELGLRGKKVLMFVGRVNAAKRVDMLAEALKKLLETSTDWHAIIIGNGDKSAFSAIPDQHKTLCDAITNPIELAPYYVASDLFVHPGLVGLAPLQAMCFNLPVVTVHSTKHKPEYAYLNEQNAVILPEYSGHSELAQAIEQYFKDHQPARSDAIWKSIQHLTMENMARNFAEGVQLLLGHP